MSHTNNHPMQTLDAETLHRYHDGELAPAERAAVEARLPADPEAQLRLAALADLSALLRAASDAETDGFDAWQAVEKKIGEGKVRGIESARPVKKKRFGAAMWAGVSSVAAAAAVVLVLLQPWRTAAAADNEIEIGDVDTDAGSVSVVKVPSDSAGTTTVFWVHTDDN